MGVEGRSGPDETCPGQGVQHCTPGNDALLPFNRQHMAQAGTTPRIASQVGGYQLCAIRMVHCIGVRDGHPCYFIV